MRKKEKKQVERSLMHGRTGWFEYGENKNHFRSSGFSFILFPFQTIGIKRVILIQRGISGWGFNALVRILRCVEIYRRMGK